MKAPHRGRSPTLYSIAVVLLAAAMAGGCQSLPPLDNRSVSTAWLDTDATRLGRAIAPRVAAEHPRTGIYPLRDSRDAFAARVLLARAAERSIDVQYYIWHGDRSGTLLFEELQAAADRGVRVRVLLDDNNTVGLDPLLQALDAHPRIEVRLFNPFTTRRARWLGFLTDFSRLNRRMHNKSFTADNQATIIGGRNVGDEYFDATEDTVFVDLDVLAIGPVVKEVSSQFDRYWASASAYPVDRLLPPADAAQLGALATKASLVEGDPATQAYKEALRNSPFVHELVEGKLPLEWAQTRMVSDDPAKGLGLHTREMALSYQLRTIIGWPQKEMEVISPYFVPTPTVAEEMAALAREGTRIRVLTNSLEATDLVVVQSGYTKRRKALLHAGVTLYELQRQPSAHRRDDRDSGSFGSSGSSLHAKTFSVDHERVFIGSFNFDSRSARFNTELGFIIDSPALAARIDDAFDHRIPALAYEVRLSDTGSLYWIERKNGKALRHDTEPGTSFWKRAFVWLMSLLPIDSLL